jgi:hypothetical protein
VPAGSEVLLRETSAAAWQRGWPRDDKRSRLTPFRPREEVVRRFRVDDGGMKFSLEQFEAARKEAESLDWLTHAIYRAAFVRLSDDELLARVGDLEDAERQMLLRELQIRLERNGNDDLQTKLERLLDALNTRFQTPGSAAQTTDRMLDRFLHRLSRDRGADLALACARSVRRGRRRAAWHFYREHGHDDASRQAATTVFSDDGRM